jgi:hypothetical protein
MATEPKELTEARTLLGKFEADMRAPASLAHLSEALAVLEDVHVDSPPAVAEIASNIAFAYQKKVQVEVESLFAREPLLHGEIVDHWTSVFAEFERTGFALSPAAALVRSKMLMGRVEKDIKLMSPAEQQELLERLQRNASSGDN